MAEGELILYRSLDGSAEVQLRAIDGTVWLTQAEISELFQTSKQSVSYHVKQILDDGELAEAATVKEFLTVQFEGGREVRRNLKLYNLEMILAIGYRVRSPRGAQFRQWATTTLREYLVKGFVIDDARLKEPGGFDYFDELLERIRDIRASEKRFYQKVRDVFAATSVDYDKSAQTAQLFFQTIRNKMLFAVTGRTAAELIVKRADAAEPNMGLTSWKSDRVRKDDVTTAKNYLEADEIDELNRIVTMFLDFADDQSRRRKQMNMVDWVAQTDRFLAFNEREVLAGAGRVSHDRMETIVHQVYTAFDAGRREREAIEAEAEHVEELKRIEAEVSRFSPNRGE